MFEEALHQPEVLHQLSWKAGDKFNVKRIVAGNLGTTIAMVGPTDHDSKDVYVRFPSVDSARALCRTNSRALKKLATTSLAAVVPRIMYEGSWKKQDFTIESRCPGQQVFYSTRDLDRMVRESCSTLLALQKQTTKPTVLVDADFDKQVAPLIQDIASYCNADVRDRLDKFARALRSALIGCEVSLGYTHGDFKIGNILVDRGGNLSALIDWDGFTESGFQIFDYLTLLTYKLSAEKSRKFPSVYLEYLLPWKLPPSYASLVEEPVSALAGNKNSFLFMRIVFWFSLISNRFDPVYKYHADWQSEFLLAVLPSFESLCESGWKFSTSTQPEIQ